MATTKTIQATVKNRTDTAANWTQKNPVLAEGEIIVVQTSAGETRLKIGDGVKTFTQLPYTDEQIYNNVVTSVNGQTGDITTNSVEYTPQTLTDAQKKQARDNVEAASEFVITATPDSSGERVTLDKTAAQIQEAVSAGKTPVVRLEAAGVSSYLRFLNAAGTTFVFGGVFSGQDGSLLNTLIVDEGGTHVTSQNLLSTDQNGRLDQQTMAYPPTEDMHIATKEYVDDGLAGKAGTDVATESANGLMSKEDKTKLDGIAPDVKGTFYVTVTQGDGNSATADKTPEEVYAAYAAGYAVYALVKFRDYGYPYILSLALAISNSDDGVFLGFTATGSSGPTEHPRYVSVLCISGNWSAWKGTLARLEDIPAIPTALKNPNALTIKIGGTTVTYDGSTAQTVIIDDGNEVAY